LKRLGRKDDLIEAQSRYIDILNSVQKSNSIEMMYTTELENQKKDIISYHSRDPLTKLFNREYFEKKVTEYIEQKRSFAFVLIDLDHFKQINDQHGHLVGDLALKHVANIFEKYDSVQFISGRFGGDEFICIYEVESVGQMKQDIQLLNDFLQIQFLVVDDQEINLSLSLGATYYAGKNESYADLFAMADAALYKSKKDGRGRANIFEKAYQ
jgi:diguanylate cyclase (GGDEF)-like protein